jgi:uncharacterized repeat protein (TIGR01451 family)
MWRKTTLFLLGLVALTTCPVLAAANSLIRSFNRTVALTNDPVVVTVIFTNSGSTTLRGFYYVDQVSSGLEVTPLSVRINGLSITNYTFESGLDGDVYVGCTPYRWVLEQPGNFTEANPLPPQAHAQIVYAISASVSGTFVLPQFGWVGYDPANTNAFFGFGENIGQQFISFLSVFPPAPPQLSLINDRVALTFSTETDVHYIVEFKDELHQAVWQTLTNLIGSGGAVLVTDPTALGTSRFYRIRLP